MFAAVSLGAAHRDGWGGESDRPVGQAQCGRSGV